MDRFAVTLLGEGFLHPAERLPRELVDQHGFLRVPVAGLEQDVQLFRCRVELPGPGAAAIECVLADGATPDTRELVQRVVSARFAGAVLLHLRSQAEGRAVVDAVDAVDATYARAAAAAVAVVMYAAAWDESELIRVELAGTRHDCGVDFEDGVHRVRVVI